MISLILGYVAIVLFIAVGITSLGFFGAFFKVADTSEKKASALDVISICVWSVVLSFFGAFVTSWMMGI